MEITFKDISQPFGDLALDTVFNVGEDNVYMKIESVTCSKTGEENRSHNAIRLSTSFSGSRLYWIQDGQKVKAYPNARLILS